MVDNFLEYSGVAIVSKSILVVDDEEAHLMWSTEILERNGYRVEVANSAEKALDMLDGVEFDLIISDLVMPGMSGIDFVRKVAETKSNQKAIIMTGHGDVDTFIESIHGLGALEYIIKPIQTDEFVNMVNKIVSPAEGAEKTA